MAKTPPDPILTRLDEILSVLQDLVIIQGEQAGLKQDTVRAILGIDRTRLSATWKHLKAVERSVKAARKDGESAKT